MRLQFDRFRGFVEEFSANLSLGGMFIRTEEPREVGAELPIEFRLGEDYELIRGKGRVVWVREEELDEEHPAGMGIRFLELTPGSRELIFKLVERRVREGGEPFDLEAEAEILDDLPKRPPDPGPAPEEALEAEPAVAAAAATGLAAAGGDGPPGDPARGGEVLTPGSDLPDLPFVAEDVDPAPTAPSADTAPEADAREAASPSAPAGDGAADTGGREPFYLGALEGGDADDPRDEKPFGEERFSEESFTSSSPVTASAPASRKVGPFGATSADGVAGAEADVDATADDAPPFARAPAAGSTIGYTPEGGGAAFDNEEERSFVRRRGLILGFLVVLVFGGLALGWWLLGQPPELKTGAEPSPDGVAVEEAPREREAATPVSPIDPADVEGGLGGVRATPPGQEPEMPPPTAGRENADEGFRGTAAGDVPGRQAAPRAGPEGDTGERPPSGEAAASDGGQAGAADGPLRIESVSHQAAGTRTVVVIQANRRLRTGDYSDFRIGGLSPRHVVRMLGVDQPLPAGQVTVGTDQVARVRSGLHLDRDPSELHLVLDFNSDTARVTEITPAGDTLRVVVEEGGG